MSEDPLLLLFGNQCCGRELKTKPAYLVELERQKAEEAAAASSTDEVQQKESDKVTEGNTVKNTEVGSEGAEENPEGNEPSSGEGAGSEEGTDHEHTQQAAADSAQEMADTFEEVKGCVEEAFRYIDRDSDGHLTKNECLLVSVPHQAVHPHVFLRLPSCIETLPGLLGRSMDMPKCPIPEQNALGLHGFLIPNLLPQGRTLHGRKTKRSSRVVGTPASSDG